MEAIYAIVLISYAIKALIIFGVAAIIVTKCIVVKFDLK